MPAVGVNPSRSVLLLNVACKLFALPAWLKLSFAKEADGVYPAPICLTTKMDAALPSMCDL